MQVRNSITLIGNLGSDPVTKILPSGRMATEFSLATNDYYRDKNGDRQTRTDWHRIKAYGKLAEIFDRHLSKGSQVCIAGALRYGKWIDKHDQVRTTAEIVADSFTFLSASKQSEVEAELATGAPSVVEEPAPVASRTVSKSKTAAPKKTAAAKGSGSKATGRKSVRKGTSTKVTTAKTVRLDPTGADLPF